MKVSTYYFDKSKIAQNGLKYFKKITRKLWIVKKNYAVFGFSRP